MGIKGNKMKYRKKPVVIDAIQINSFLEPDISKLYDFVDAEFSDEDRRNGKTRIVWDMKDLSDGSADIFPTIKTLEGNMAITEGDFIIKGVAGEFYPCKPDIFEKTYEEALDLLPQFEGTRELLKRIPTEKKEV
jgi:hypothetical protein